MTVEQFKRFQFTKPYQPFVIHVADGREFPVTHPEAASLSPSGRTVLVFNKDRLLEVLDMLLVTSLRPVPTPESAFKS
jgi:hypothetical protein